MKTHTLLLTVVISALGLLYTPTAFAQAGDDSSDDASSDDASSDDASSGDDADSKADKRTRRKSRRQAREKSNEGARLAGEQNYDKALEAFRAAYELDPLPDTLFNLGTVSRLKGEARQAHEYYQQYLNAAPNGRLAASARRFMKGLEADIAEEDARLAREKQLEEQAEANRLQAERAEREAAHVQQTQAQALQQAQADLEQTRRESALMEHERDDMEAAMRTGRGSQKRAIGTSLIALGGLSLGWAIKSGLDARSAHNELDGLGTEDSWSQGYQWVHDHGQRSENRMIVFSITGALLVGGGATLYYLGNRESRRVRKQDARALSVAPAVGPRTTGIQVSGRF